MSDKTPLDDKWLSIADDWQSQPYEKIDIAALSSKAKKRTYGAIIILVLDIIATVVLYFSAITGYLFYQWEPAINAYLAFGGLLSTIYVYYEIKIRRITWQMSEGGPEQAVARYISGIEGSVKFCQLIKYSCYAIVPAVNLFIWAMVSGTDKSIWPPVFIANGLTLAMIVAAHRIQQKRKQELNAIKKSVD